MTDAQSSREAVDVSNEPSREAVDVSNQSSREAVDVSNEPSREALGVSNQSSRDVVRGFNQPRRVAGAAKHPLLRLALAAGLALLATGLAGCGPSQDEATQNTYLASINGLNIDSDLGREFEEVHTTPPLSILPEAQDVLDLARKNGDWTAARGRLQLLVEQHPDDASCWFYFGKVLRELKQQDSSLKALAKATTLRSDLPELWLELADANLQGGNTLDAFNAAGTAAATDPTAPASLQQAARIFYQLGRYDAAESALNTMTTLSPDNPSGWHDRGRNFAASGRASLASACFDRCLSIYAKTPPTQQAQKRDYAEALTDYGIVSQWDQSDEKAKLLFDKAVEVDPTYAMGWFKLSQQQSLPNIKPLFDIDAAIRSANKAVALSDAKNDEFLHQLAKVYAMGGNLDRAVVAEEQASLLAHDKYTRTLEMLKKLQSDHSRAFNPNQF